jgi:hypothetical protein
MATGGGMYWVSGFVTLLTLMALVGLNAFDRAFRHDTYRHVTIRAPVDADVTRNLEAVRTTGAPSWLATLTATIELSR